MTDEAVLRTAAVMAVLSMLDESSGTADVGRLPGEAWSSDHRRQAMGRQSLMRTRSGRAPWR
ncbi:MAG: hypothetical protein DWC11_07730 [Candidatus Poseidoniales archaeon]|nr:MAG: hypothetical protein DWC11_07730 [Candidatus Poseidoniales archaeon]